MDTAWFFTYIVIFILQISMLVVSIRKKTKKAWLGVFCLELIPMPIAIGLSRYFDSLPGFGFMPGLTYFGIIVFLWGAAAVCGVLFLISLIIYIVGRKKWS